MRSPNSTVCCLRRGVTDSHSAGEVGKVLGEKWKALTEAQKAPYDKKAAADKKRYEDEKAAYAAVRRAPPEDFLEEADIILQGATADDDDE